MLPVSRQPIYSTYLVATYAENIEFITLINRSVQIQTITHSMTPAVSWQPIYIQHNLYSNTEKHKVHRPADSSTNSSYHTYILNHPSLLATDLNKQLYKLITLYLIPSSNFQAFERGRFN